MVDPAVRRAKSTAGRGEALTSLVRLDLSSADNLLALADLHASLADDASLLCHVIGGSGGLSPTWTEQLLADTIEGAGFEVEAWTTGEPHPLGILGVERVGSARSTRSAQLKERHSVRSTYPLVPFDIRLRLRRRFTLADTIGPNMRMLICGLNPSIYSAEVGVGFGRPGNRFWPAALAARLVSRDRDPRHALTAHGMGMTDLVKRPTRRASELEPTEYRDGLERVERLAAWLQPRVVCFVGLAGWRIAVDRKARAGWQDHPLGGCDVYLMPSTSGLNASSQLPDFIDHFQTAVRGRSDRAGDLQNRS